MTLRAFGVLAIVGAALAGCATQHDPPPQRTSMTQEECDNSVPAILNSRYQAPFAGLKPTALPRCHILGDKYPYVVISYDLAHASSAQRRKLGLAPGVILFRFIVVQDAPNKPKYVEITKSDEVRVGTSDADGGDITISAPRGSNLTILARVAIVDPQDQGVDSNRYAWKEGHPHQSLGAAEVGQDGCRTVDACPGAAPGHWPFDPRKLKFYDDCVESTFDCHVYLQFEIPYQSGKSYKYWMRAFDAFNRPYDIDPKIINQPG